MSNFEAAFKHIIDVEKGYSAHKADNGGSTKFGISQRFLSKWLGRPVSIDEIKALSIPAVRVIYKTAFWDEMKLDDLPAGLSLAVFDQAVNRGAPNAVLQLQGALGIQQDAIMGPVTRGLAMSANERELIWKFILQSQTAYCRIVQNDPSQVLFISGWMARLSTLVAKLLLAESPRGSSTRLSLVEATPSPIA